MKKLGLFLMLTFGSMPAFAEDLEEFAGGGSDLELGSRIVTILVFLAVMVGIAYYIKCAAKSGKLKLPDFILNKVPFIKDANNKQKLNPYNMSLIQKKAFDDGSEMWVMEVNDRHILVGKTLNGGFDYLTELKTQDEKTISTTVENEFKELELNK